MRKIKFFILSFILLAQFTIANENDNKADSLKNISLSGLKFRSIGPAVTGGRISAIAVNPNDHSEYYVGSGHGNLWKTTNKGITFSPTFDNQGAYAIGAIAIDPTNTNVVWIGTGENNNQNNVIYGDGVYKSEDGGKSWKNMGIKNSEHIGGIAIDPNNSNTVFVAAYGSLRNKGGDRGIFKTTDGGKIWENVLFISENTGCFQVHMDPRYSNILYAVAHQRMRKLYTGVSGGPESGIYRSTDSGITWDKITSGLPKEDIGRIGMSISPANPDVIYAIVEATSKDKGFYKSVDRGVSWSKQSSYISSYPFYFQKIIADQKDADRVYSMDVFMQVTIDGGKTWKNVGSKNKHVDDHSLWINPDDNRHLIAGCDGGVYESYNQGKDWNFKANIPITEIYKVSVDNSKPFYNVYIGTQDNNSLSGPSRTVNSSGIMNQDWLFTNSGDGFETQVDWIDPNIVYAQSQNGGLVRFDKQSGENLFIKPYEFADTAYRFDWDAALLISQHDNKRLYFGGNKLLRTDDQGSTWREISPDLTRGVPKEMEKLMGVSWSIDQLARKGSMAQIVSIAESIIDENILFVGSGDGLIHYTQDGGISWSKSSLDGLPKYARIHHIVASNHNKQTAYAACHNFLGGDYKPYIYKTNNGGKTWFLINGNLPDKGTTYTIVEDHVIDDLLFIGTQFGVFFSNNGGRGWIPLKNGIPTHTVMDIEIQRDENDLVVSTFGRGVYIMDDYSPLRNLTAENLKKEAFIFQIKNALMFVAANPFGFRGIGFQGASFYSAPNPEVGAVFTYFIRDKYKTLKDKRRDSEKEMQKERKDIKYPSYESLNKEEEQPNSYLLFTVRDEMGNIIRKLKTDIKQGVNRIVWDFRYNTFTPVSLKPFDDTVPWLEADKGYMVVPGNYNVSLSKFENGNFTELVSPQMFVCKTLTNTSIPSEDKPALDKFNKEVGELTRAIYAADSYRSEMVDKLAYLKRAVHDGANVPEETYIEIITIELKLNNLNRELNGDNLRSRYEGARPTSVKERAELITNALWNTSAAPTNTFLKSYEDAAGKFGAILLSLKSIDEEIKTVETVLEKNSAPYTPGRFPEWNKN